MRRSKKLFWVGCVSGLLVAAVIGWARAGRVPVETGYNLLVISVDTLRPDHLGCYGYHRDTSSTIDELAANGVLFTNAFAQRALTWPSLASIMTSTYPITHGVRTNGIKLDRTQPALAAVLEEHGYTCEAVLANSVEQNWQGFDEVKLAQGEGLTLNAWSALERLHNAKFFLWLHYVAPHAPYDPPEGYQDLFDPDYAGAIDGKKDTLDRITENQIQLSEADLNHIVSLYDGEVAFVDDQIEQVIRLLDHYGIRDNTLVVFTSDHGEDLYQHNFYFDHLASVYDSSLKIPLIFHLPGAIEPSRVDTIVESIDIAPTVLEILGIAAPDTFQGASLAPLLEGHDIDLGPSFSEWQDQIITVRTDGHRYVTNPLGYHPRWLTTDPEPRYPIDEIELYEVETDPVESANVAQENPGLLQGFHHEAATWIERYGWRLNEFEGTTFDIEPELKAQLEDMGYVF